MTVLLFGAQGQVGWELRRALSALGEVVIPDRRSYDFKQPESLRAVVDHHRPDAIVNAAAYTAVDRAETDIDACFAVNAAGPQILAEAADRHGAWLVHYSTDYVFDGTKAGPYVEDDECAPLSVYGSSKWTGEKAVSQAARHLIFRTSWVHSRRGGNFVKTMCRLASERSEIKVVADQYGAPTDAALIADVTALALYRVRLGLPMPSQTYHLVSAGEASWFDVACEAINFGHEIGLISQRPEILPIGSVDYPTPARRPQNSRLNTERLRSVLAVDLPDWRIGVHRTVQELMEQKRT